MGHPDRGKRGVDGHSAPGYDHYHGRNRYGLEVAKAIALGASAAGIARPVLQTLTSGGRTAAENYLDGIEAELRAAMLLVGAGNIAELRRAPRIISGELASWIAQGSLEGPIS